MGDPFNQAKAIFLAAIEDHPPEQWPDFLEQACAGDVRLRAQVEKLLRAHAEMGSFHEAARPALVATIDDPISERPGTMIGPYKLLEQIGEGGFGVVFMAEQTQPIRRKVALKVLKPGMDTRQVVVRFEAERQALALMDHPHIAHVFDGGETATGRPYFVMELVRGVPITDFCDQNRLSIRERLELFVNVCQAVQHAHQKGIIHRDIKPSNVMVTLHDGTPVVKVIDFGIAKATGQQLTDKTLFTNFAQMIGTPLYMSPEQAGMSGLDVDTRSDIYSLGVLLYELLTGTTPFNKEQLREASYEEIRRLIREEEPPKPSTRISTLGKAVTTISTQRQSEPKQLSRLFRGELDWIVMKALEKDRSRRYETANGFAMDVQRYLHDEPVLACPPSAGYRLRKVVRRKKTALLMAFCFFLALAGIAGGMGWSVRDRVARSREAEGRFAEALKSAEPQLRKGHPWDPILISAAQRAEAELAGGTLGREVRLRAEQLLRDIHMLAELDEIRLRQAESKDGSLFDTAGAEKGYAAAFLAYGLDAAVQEPAQAAARIGDSAIHEALLGGLDAWMQLKPAQDSGRAWLRKVADASDDNDWRRSFRAAALDNDTKKLQALAGQAEALAQPPGVLTWLGSVLDATGLRKEAEAIMRLAQTRYPGDFWINYNLGHFLIFGPPPHHPEEAVGYFRVAVAIRPGSAEARSILGLSLYMKRDNDEAIAAYRQAIALDPRFAIAHHNLGNALWAKGQLDESLAEFREALRLNPAFKETHVRIGIALMDKNQLGEAIGELSEGIRLKPNNWDAWYLRGKAYLKQGQRDKGLADYTHVIEQNPTDVAAWFARGFVYTESLQEHKKAVSDFSKVIELNPKSSRAHTNRGVALGRLGQHEKALADWSKAIELDPKNILAWRNRGHLYRHLRRLDEALADFSKVLELDSKTSETWRARGNVYSALGQWEKAVADFSKALGLDSRNINAWIDRGAVYTNNLGQHDKALTDICKAIELDPKDPWSWIRRGTVYARLGEVEKAVADYSKAVEINPKLAAAWLNRGLAYGTIGQWDNARRDYTKVLELKPNTASAQNNLAWLLATCPVEKRRDPKRAVELAKKVVELTRNEGGHWNTLGVAHYRCHDYQAAIAALQKSMELRKGGDSFDWFFLAMAHWQLGNKKEARTWFEKAITW